MPFGEEQVRVRSDLDMTARIWLSLVHTSVLNLLAVADYQWTSDTTDLDGTSCSWQSGWLMAEILQV